MKLDIDKLKTKNPIKRNRLFFSDESFNIELDFAMDYMEHDTNQTVILYEVDLENTSNDILYHESEKDEIKFKTPIEINVIYTIGGSEQKSYDKQKYLAVYLKTGKLTFHVMEKTLESLSCSIKRGDYIGVQITPEHIEYFEVADPGTINYDNKHTMYGTTPYYRTVECSMVDSNQFKG